MQIGYANGAPPCLNALRAFKLCRKRAVKPIIFEPTISFNGHPHGFISCQAGIIYLCVAPEGKSRTAVAHLAVARSQKCRCASLGYSFWRNINEEQTRRNS